jgi:hypothetical protein
MTGDLLICQSNACYSYLGRKLDLWGNTDTDVVLCEQLLCEAMDLRNLVVGYCYGRTGDPTDTLQAAAFITGIQEGILAKFEQWLTLQAPHFNPATPFFVSEHATAPDFHIFELLDQLNLLAECRSLPAVTDAVSLPKVHAFYQHFQELPGNAKYFSSVMASAPCNNLTAGFGSVTQGGQWERGVALPEDVGGIY